MGLRCFFFSHEVSEMDWHRCRRCNEVLPPIEDPLTFDEGFEYGLKVAADRLNSYANKIEHSLSPEDKSAVTLRKVANKLIYSEDKEWYK